MHIRSKFFVVFGLLAAAFLTSCQQAAEIQDVAIAAADYSFDAPDTLEAGWTRLTMSNQGQELHHAQLVRLEEGKTMADLGAAVQAMEEGGGIPEWVGFEGGPSLAVPGGRTSAVANLQPGNYVLLCLMPDAEGTPHLALGMAKPITVAAADAEPEPPAADNTLTLADFSFTFSETLEAGEQTVKVVNAGPQPHEAFIVKLNEGATAEEFLASMAPGAPPGPPPGVPVGGIQAMDPGAEGYFTVDFESGGQYLLVCVVPDPASGAPHFALGMQQTIQVN